MDRITVGVGRRNISVSQNFPNRQSKPVIHLEKVCAIPPCRFCNVSSGENPVQQLVEADSERGVRRGQLQYNQ